MKTSRKRITTGKSSRRVSKDISTAYELYETEREFSELISGAWEVINEHPSLHSRALFTASRLRELRFVLKASGVLSKTVH